MKMLVLARIWRNMNQSCKGYGWWAVFLSIVSCQIGSLLRVPPLPLFLSTRWRSVQKKGWRW